jgi:hypothetical protein
MSLDKKRVEEFQKIFEKEYNKKMSYAEAEEAGNNLVGLFKILMDTDRRNKSKKS